MNGCHETFTLLMDHPKTVPTNIQRQNAIRTITMASYNVNDETIVKLQRLVDKPGMDEFLSTLVNRESPKCHPKTLPTLIAAGGVMETNDVVTHSLEPPHKKPNIH